MTNYAYNNATVASKKGVIYEVWQNNINEAFQMISEIMDDFPYVAIDTEFPGVVVRPTNNYYEYYYQTVRFNVDLLKVIQIGLSFRNKYGQAPTNICSTFQFNFKFDMECDIYSQESIQFLRHSGIEFDKHLNSGIDFLCFGEYMYGSGLVLNPKVKWISFHGCYDFAYLVKILSSQPLPETETNFIELVKALFPTLYDLKFILKQLSSLSHLSSLQKLSEHLKIQRIGIAHQAGSDALVTCCTFFKLFKLHLNSQVDDNLFNGQIYGFGLPPPTIVK
ncbi:CAF1 family ribonuclease family protein [Cryptosporidium hominis]|nr:CAF1 family ribonuclease [Cryptosporidium hominis]PPA65245.1 CAF1 family ribonuclease family protein [Cryptosporidium hominis]